MANAFNANAKVWALDSVDLLSHKNKSDANSGFVPTCIRMVRFRPAATTDTCIFNTIQPSATPDLAIASDTYTVTNTARITDASSGAVFNGAAVGDWAHLINGSGVNEGWYLITAVDGSKHYIDVAYSTRVLTNETSKLYTIDIYTPETCMYLICETGDTGAKAIKTEVIDWGPQGRYFTNIALGTIGGGTVDVYLK